MTDTDETMIEQGTEEWRRQRLGKATGSRIADIIAKGKSGASSASRKNYAAQLVIERLTEEVQPGFSSEPMEWGNDKEPEARAAYAFLRADGVTVTKAGFVDHPRIPMAGASPDSYVGEDGLLEIKCPNSATHMETILGKSPPAKYMTQMQWVMACTGRQWCDFVSYDPRFPENLALHVIRVPRDQKRIIELETEVSIFLREVSAAVDALKALELEPAA